MRPLLLRQDRILAGIPDVAVVGAPGNESLTRPDRRCNRFHAAAEARQQAAGFRVATPDVRLRTPERTDALVVPPVSSGSATASQVHHPPEGERLT
jgi:hypothetical protein